MAQDKIEKNREYKDKDGNTILKVTLGCDAVNVDIQQIRNLSNIKTAQAAFEDLYTRMYEAAEGIELLESAIRNIMNPISYSFNIVQSTCEYTGSNVTLTFNSSVLQEGEALEDDYMLKLYLGDSATPFWEGNANNTGTNITSVAAIKNRGNFTIKGKFYKEDNPGVVIKEISDSVKVMHKIRMGFIPVGNQNVEELNSTTLALVPKRNAFTFPLNNVEMGNTDNRYLWVCCDESINLGGVNSNSQPVPMRGDVPGETTQYGGTTHEWPLVINNYKCYRSDEIFTPDTQHVFNAIGK